MTLVNDPCPNITHEAGDCQVFYDEVMCWGPSPPNTTVYQPCPQNHHLHAHRHCMSNGEWEERTNYSTCLRHSYRYTSTQVPHTTAGSLDASKRNLMLLMFTLSIVSLVVLFISLIIFQRFKSLQCQRTSIHKNLIVSFILRSLIVVILFEPLVFDHYQWYDYEEWMCRIMKTLEVMSYVANFFWMLVEGLYLHLILVMRPLNNDKVPFLIFYFIGWGIPLMFAVTWALVMQFETDSRCWRDTGHLMYNFIIYVPIMFALFVNILILLNLIRIIVMKLCTGHNAERRRICRTIKSTVVLVFLLGIINLLFFTVNSDPLATLIYRYVNAILPNCQGIVIAVVYCGFNSEVRRSIRKRWDRYLDLRSLHGSNYRGRNSRTSVSMIMSRQHPCNESEPQVVELQALKDPLANGNSHII